jgi:hypothetical protein
MGMPPSVYVPTQEDIEQMETNRLNRESREIRDERLAAINGVVDAFVNAYDDHKQKTTLQKFVSFISFKK